MSPAGGGEDLQMRCNKISFQIRCCKMLLRIRPNKIFFLISDIRYVQQNIVLEKMQQNLVLDKMQRNLVQNKMQRNLVWMRYNRISFLTSWLSWPLSAGQRCLTPFGATCTTWRYLPCATNTLQCIVQHGATLPFLFIRCIAKSRSCSTVRCSAAALLLKVDSGHWSCRSTMSDTVWCNLYNMALPLLLTAVQKVVAAAPSAALQLPCVAEGWLQSLNSSLSLCFCSAKYWIQLTAAARRRHRSFLCSKLFSVFLFLCLSVSAVQNIERGATVRSSAALCSRRSVTELLRFFLFLFFSAVQNYEVAAARRCHRPFLCSKQPCSRRSVTELPSLCFCNVDICRHSRVFQKNTFLRKWKVQPTMH